MTPDQNTPNLLQRESIAPKRFDPRSATPFVNKSVSEEGVSEDEKQTDPKTKGTSAVQFILTSTIVIHTLDLMKAAYVNIFSCKDFDTDEAAQFTAKWFGSTDWTATVVTRR
jgi:S-adenosylmethionine/arginine decarboxylase-like enzyme